MEQADVQIQVEPIRSFQNPINYDVRQELVVETQEQSKNTLEQVMAEVNTKQGSTEHSSSKSTNTKRLARGEHFSKDNGREQETLGRNHTGQRDVTLSLKSSNADLQENGKASNSDYSKPARVMCKNG